MEEGDQAWLPTGALEKSAGPNGGLRASSGPMARPAGQGTHLHGPPGDKRASEATLPPRQENGGSRGGARHGLPPAQARHQTSAPTSAAGRSAGGGSDVAPGPNAPARPTQAARKPAAFPAAANGAGQSGRLDSGHTASRRHDAGSERPRLPATDPADAPDISVPVPPRGARTVPLTDTASAAAAAANARMARQVAAPPADVSDPATTHHPVRADFRLLSPEYALDYCYRNAGVDPEAARRELDRRCAMCGLALGEVHELFRGRFASCSAHRPAYCVCLECVASKLARGEGGKYACPVDGCSKPLSVSATQWGEDEGRHPRQELISALQVRVECPFCGLRAFDTGSACELAAHIRRGGCHKTPVVCPTCLRDGADLAEHGVVPADGLIRHMVAAHGVDEAKIPQGERTAMVLQARKVSHAIGGLVVSHAVLPQASPPGSPRRAPMRGMWFPQAAGAAFARGGGIGGGGAPLDESAQATLAAMISERNTHTSRDFDFLPRPDSESDDEILYDDPRRGHSRKRDLSRRAGAPKVRKEKKAGGARPAIKPATTAAAIRPQQAAPRPQAKLHRGLSGSFDAVPPRPAAVAPSVRRRRELAGSGSLTAAMANAGRVARLTVQVKGDGVLGPNKSSTKAARGLHRRLRANRREACDTCAPRKVGCRCPYEPGEKKPEGYDSDVHVIPSGAESELTGCWAPMGTSDGEGPAAKRQRTSGPQESAAGAAEAELDGVGLEPDATAQEGGEDASKKESES
ncbi:unnamed protein product [Pedinophyceae sp. YPF-701]|nr:unnamed protein product [Pedinophyceae sp. YPF-701]